MQLNKLDAQFREKKSKGELNLLRKEGFVTAVVYGKEIDSLPVLVKEKDVEKILKTRSGMNTILDLKVSGLESPVEHKVMIKDIQYDPIKRNMVHLDIFKFSAQSKLQTTVPINLVGTAVGQKEGGILQHLLREVDIECLPTEIPNELTVDISNLQMGDSILVSDVAANNDKYTILNDPHSLIVSVAAPRAEETEAEEAETDATPETAAEQQEEPKEE